MNILDILESAPALIAAENQKVVEAEQTLAHAEHHLKIAKAAATIRFKDEKNATLTKAYVDTDEEVQAKELAVIAADAAAKIARNRADRVMNEWISARKVASLDERELRSISGSTIRTEPQH